RLRFGLRDGRGVRYGRLEGHDLGRRFRRPEGFGDSRFRGWSREVGLWNRDVFERYLCDRELCEWCRFDRDFRFGRVCHLDVSGGGRLRDLFGRHHPTTRPDDRKPRGELPAPAPTTQSGWCGRREVGLREIL